MIEIINYNTVKELSTDAKMALNAKINNTQYNRISRRIININELSDFLGDTFYNATFPNGKNIQTIENVKFVKTIKDTIGSARKAGPKRIETLMECAVIYDTKNKTNLQDVVKNTFF